MRDPDQARAFALLVSLLLFALALGWVLGRATG